MQRVEDISTRYHQNLYPDFLSSRAGICQVFLETLSLELVGDNFYGVKIGSYSLKFVL